jgi:alpha-glucosidase
MHFSLQKGFSTAIFFVVAALSSISSAATSGFLVADGVAQFQPTGFDRASAPLFPGFVTQPDSTGPLPSSWTITPIFSTSNNRNVATITIEAGTSLYGTGEVAGGLLRNGKVTENWNSDVYGYDSTYKNLYQSHPWVLAVRADGSAYGVLALTTYRSEINLQSSIKFSATGPQFPVVIFTGSNPQAVLQSLAKQIGTIAMPPRWAIGYQQCRYSYTPASRVKEIADNFRSRSIPCDVIWMDIDYMNGYRIFNFNPLTFSDPSGLNTYLHEKRFHSVWMIDPGIKAEAGYSVFDQGTAGDYFVKKSDNSVFNGDVWPGSCAFPDFTNPKACSWWSGLYKEFMAKGVDGVWNDMNEPAVFNGPNGSMPEDNKHSGGVLNIKSGIHAQYHNIYGMLMVKASREGILAANPTKRPFVLSRANFTGGHRYAATWTGDNTANWYHLGYSVPMILNLSMSGQPFCGPDIGGFKEDGTAALFARWIGVGAFFPFSRSHANAGTRDKEPWAWDAATENTSRTALNRRYVLLPYLYTLFYQSSINGMPVMQPAFFADLTNASLRSEWRSFLLGSDLLVVPRLQENASITPAEPRGIWHEIRIAGENPDVDVNQPRIKIRNGAIIPTSQLVQNTLNYKIDTLTLWVCPDSNGHAAGQLYEDAGEGFDYQQGSYLLTTYSCDPVAGGVKITIKETMGNLTRGTRVTRVKVVTKDSIGTVYGTETSGISVTGKFTGTLHREATLASVQQSTFIVKNNNCFIQGLGQHVTSLRLYNALGQQLLMRTFSKKENSAIIDLAPHSKSGILFAKLESNGKSIVRKFILK